ncbi:MAG TPA: hypothetical protein VLH15_05865 [Dehalococcoidales bacterium]|nr:hypothetical protein [Dehalococcoidales bacterium]
MWVEIKSETSLTAARRWKEVIENEGIPVRLLPPKGAESGNYRVLVPQDKAHLIEEVLKTL